MMKRLLSSGLLALLLLSSKSIGSPAFAQEDPSHIRVNVVLVQLNIAVTDRKGHYITGLRPENFQVMEDKIPERIATFEEGNGPVVKVSGTPPSSAGNLIAQNSGPTAPTPGGMKFMDSTMGSVNTPLAGANVFILFDTSNYMYRGFVFAQDAIANFVRSLEGVDRVAFYSYSRDLSRATQLTSDRAAVMQGVRSTVAGDDAALYNSLLMTVKDAAPLRGRKAIVVFSNGPDNASSVPPEDVAELAQSTGTIIYMISTQQAQGDPVSTAVFERMSKATGGKAYFAKNWEDEKRAFGSIREDLAHLYSISYYPQPNPNRGWRAISVKLVGHGLEKYHVRTRDGYRLRQQTQ
ncbi:VWA domain-containing protein [Pseudacidobacterium ailaaui]|jgi:VWFA-related protein|uniref:VWA domain-containing protein n=1 Tax=Pseudacidobacterium ailaaui TaxID=1382359 RepID=UPI0005D24AE5|nr:VWA domain-containing protein [Pseudacidobacterium ailaaui]